MSSCCVSGAHWFVILILSSLAAIALSAWAWHLSEPIDMMYLKDSKGYRCGRSNKQFTETYGLDLAEYQFLLYYDPVKMEVTNSVCVRSCPDYDFTNVAPVWIYMYEHDKYFCDYVVESDRVEKNLSQVETFRKVQEGDFTSTGKCPVLPIVTSIPILGMCTPRFIQNAMQVFSQLNGLPNNYVYIHVLRTTFVQFLLCIFVACIISLIYYLCLRSINMFSAGFIGISSMMFMLGLLGCIWWAFAENHALLDNTIAKGYQLRAVDVVDEIVLFSFGITLIVFALFLLVAVGLNAPLLTSGQIYDHVASFLASFPCLLFVPLVTTVTVLVVISCGLASSYFVLAVPVTAMQVHPYWLFVVLVPTGLWWVYFVQYLASFAVSDSFIQWSKGEDVTYCPPGECVGLAAGLALIALLLAPVRLLATICLACRIDCGCLWFLWSLDAVPPVALHDGTSLCSSWRTASEMLTKFPQLGAAVFSAQLLNLACVSGSVFSSLLVLVWLLYSTAYLVAGYYTLLTATVVVVLLVPSFFVVYQAAVFSLSLIAVAQIQLGDEQPSYDLNPELLKHLLNFGSSPRSKVPALPKTADKYGSTSSFKF